MSAKSDRTKGGSLSIQPIYKYPMRKSKASEALRVAQQLAAIRAVLKQHGYHLRKRPKQAAWNVLTPLVSRESGRKLTPPLATEAGGVKAETATTHPNKSYLLTYQPAPISAWVLHPPTNDPSHQTIETLIQQAITRSAL